MVDLTRHFDEFIEEVSLKDAQVERIESAWQTLADYLREGYGLDEDDVFLQGSYVNHTAIEPVEGGEYDVDVVCICASADNTPDEALNSLETVLKDSGRYRDRIKRKKPCVRLEYADDEAGKFHVDVVPVRRGETNLEAPRRGEDWFDTAPAEYTEWCAQQGEAFQRTVKILKRWRDENQSVRSAVKSIVLQVLIAEVIELEDTDDQSRVADTLSSLHEWLEPLESAPVLVNPVLNTENLATRWTDESFRSFVDALGEAVELVDLATGSTDPIDASDAWRDLLGEDFPMLEAEELGLEVSDYGHVKRPNEQGWTFKLAPGVAISVSGEVQRGKRDQRWRLFVSGKTVVSAGHNVRFTATVTGATATDVWWQVGNTGEHARIKKALRGEFFRAKRYSKERPSPDRRVNFEQTLYTGSHLIRAVVVVDNVMVARSDWFVVNIYNRGWIFRR